MSSTSPEQSRPKDRTMRATMRRSISTSCSSETTSMASQNLRWSRAETASLHIRSPAVVDHQSAKASFEHGAATRLAIARAKYIPTDADASERRSPTTSSTSSTIPPTPRRSSIPHTAARSPNFRWVTASGCLMRLPTGSSGTWLRCGECWSVSAWEGSSMTSWGNGARTRLHRWECTSLWQSPTGLPLRARNWPFADWWSTTAGDRMCKLAVSALDHRRFWDAMDAVSDAQLVEIERRIVARMVRSFGLDCSGLVLDMTNFATYIDSGNDRAPIAQRGHAKQKRTDLRLMGLGLVVSTDFGVPLVSHAYAGNRPDVTQFADMVSWEGVERHQLLPVLGDLLGGLRPLGLVVLDELIECPLSVVAVFGVTDLFEGGIGQCH